MGNELYCEHLTEYGCCRLKIEGSSEVCRVYKTPELCDMLKEIPMVKVVSSNISAVGWKKNALRIMFNKGTKYEYFGVPRALAMKLIKSPSIGSFFYKNIAKKFEFKQKED